MTILVVLWATISLTATAVVAADTPAPGSTSEFPPGSISIKPTGRKRVCTIGKAPPPPVVDYRLLARGDSPKGGGPYIHYPVGYCPVYSFGDCHAYSSYGAPYGYSGCHRGYSSRCGW